jgi:hypothetical protein
LLAAALLRERLAEDLLEPEREPSSSQLEYLGDLDFWAKPREPRPDTALMASALIRLREARRTLQWLCMIKPCRGDVVVEFRRSDMRDDGDQDPDRQRLVASVGEDGVVHFAGGGGHRARVTRLEMRYRVGDASPQAEKARLHAAKAAAERRAAGRYSSAMNGAKFHRLLPWLVDRREIYGRDVDALRGVIETAKDEAQIQQFLTERPHLLTAVLRGAQGCWLVPQLRLGDKYVADFFMADADSAGIRWQLVELESPRVQPLTKTSEWRKEARHAQHQISTWRHYLRENLDSARKPREDEGLGLVDVESGVPGLILISRRNMVVRDPAWMRRELSIDSGVAMHTYDWLIEQVERAAASSTGLR